jgi:hypothetical protein
VQVIHNADAVEERREERALRSPPTSVKPSRSTLAAMLRFLSARG